MANTKTKTQLANDYKEEFESVSRQISKLVFGGRGKYNSNLDDGYDYGDEEEDPLNDIDLQSEQAPPQITKKEFCSRVRQLMGSIDGGALSDSNAVSELLNTEANISEMTRAYARTFDGIYEMCFLQDEDGT